MAYIYDLSDAWAASGTTFTAIKMSVTDTASAAGSLLMDLQVGGSSKFSVSKTGVLSGPVNSNNFSQPSVAIANSNLFSEGTVGVASAFLLNGSNANTGFSLSGSYPLSWSSTTGPITNYANLNTIDLQLRRDAANTLAQRNGVNAQAFNLYNTYTDASNYERGRLAWVSNGLVIGTQPAGTGTARGISLEVGGTGTSLNLGGGAITLVNAALNLGGATSSFPALKRSTTSMQVRLGDDSAFTNIRGKLTTDTNYTAGVTTPTGYIVLFDGNGTAYKVPAEAL